MVRQLSGRSPAHFFYHLGDIVYPHGEEANYRSQFFAPYAASEAPIFALPGNHDGEVMKFSGADPLEPFMRTFCSSSPPLHDAAIAVPRAASAQPNVYWTLIHDWLRVIGLYTNVHEDGEIADDQLDWLTGELAATPPEVTLILTVHRPVYSVDVVTAPTCPSETHSTTASPSQDACPRRCSARTRTTTSDSGGEWVSARSRTWWREPAAFTSVTRSGPESESRRRRFRAFRTSRSRPTNAPGMDS